MYTHLSNNILVSSYRVSMHPMDAKSRIKTNRCVPLMFQDRRLLRGEGPPWACAAALAECHGIEPYYNNVIGRPLLPYCYGRHTGNSD